VIDLTIRAIFRVAGFEAERTRDPSHYRASGRAVRDYDGFPTILVTTQGPGARSELGPQRRRPHRAAVELQEKTILTSPEADQTISIRPHAAMSTRGGIPPLDEASIAFARAPLSPGQQTLRRHPASAPSPLAQLGVTDSRVCICAELAPVCRFAVGPPITP
jgi:hypothetical protein